MICSLGSSNFLEEISSLSHSIVFLYFFALIAEESFIFPCYSWELCIQMGISFLFSAVCKVSSDNHFAFLHFFFLGMVLITASCTMSRTFIHSSSGTLSDLIPWIYLSHPLYNLKGLDLVVFPIFFNLRVNLAIKNSWSEPQSAHGLVLFDCVDHLCLQRI